MVIQAMISIEIANCQTAQNVCGNKRFPTALHWKFLNLPKGSKAASASTVISYFKSVSSYWLKGFPVLHSSLLKGHTGNSSLVQNSTVQIRKTIFDQCEDTGLTCGFNSYWWNLDFSCSVAKNLLLQYNIKGNVSRELKGFKRGINHSF